MKTLILFGAFFSALNSFATAKNVPSIVTETSSRFHQTMVVCPQRIWTDYNWKSFKVLFVRPDKEFSWVWDGETNSVQSTPSSSLPTKARNSHYNFFKDDDGVPILSLRVEDDEDKNSWLFDLGVHEFFHYQGQKDWEQKRIGVRGTDYPIEIQPRLYRSMIFKNLKSYFFNHDIEKLQQAKYWFLRWKSEFPDEVNMSTDGYEGTAEYVSQMAVMISNVGCEATEKDFVDIIKTQFRNEVFGQAFRGTNLSLSAEGYHMGALAAVILRFGDYDLRTWNSAMREGVTPLEYLLQNVSPKTQRLPNKSTTMIFEQSRDQQNKEIGRLADASIENWMDRDYIRIPVRFEFLQSNFSPHFFARSSEIGLGFMPLSGEYHFSSPKEDGSKYVLKSDPVAFDYVFQECPDQHYYTLVNKRDVYLSEKNSFSVLAKNVDGHFFGQKKVSRDGFSFLCVQ